jgi:biopolymer transport protein ExbB/TolQ
MAERRSARIRSPEIIKRFRHKYVEFDEQARTALETITNDVRSVSGWLHREQLKYWEREFRKRHDKMKEAWRDYVNARYSDPKTGKPSCVDERKAWELAKRRRAEAQAKIEHVKRWAIRLEQEVEKLMPRCHRFDELIARLTPKALARLDHMLDNLEDYLRPTAPPAKSRKKPE